MTSIAAHAREFRRRGGAQRFKAGATAPLRCQAPAIVGWVAIGQPAGCLLGKGWSRARRLGVYGTLGRAHVRIR